MAFGVKFVPLTHDGCSPQSSEASCSKMLDEYILSMREHMSPEEYKRELLALRERDMAITKPTQPEYFARSRPPVQIASPPYDPLYDRWPNYDFELPFPYTSPSPFELESYPYSYPYFMTSPTDTDISTNDYDSNVDTTSLDPWLLDQYMAEMQPDGFTDDSEYLDLEELQAEMSTDDDVQDDSSSTTLDDDPLQTLADELDSAFGADSKNLFSNLESDLQDLLSESTAVDMEHAES